MRRDELAGWRRGFALLVIAQLALLVFFSYSSDPRVLSPLCFMRQSRVQPPPLALFAMTVTNAFQSFWVLFGLAYAAFGFLVLSGRLDRFIRPVVLFFLVMFAATGALSAWVETLPEWLRQTAGNEVYWRIYGR